MKRILVTGGAGFIGRRALPLLTQKGYEVHAICLNKEEACFDRAHWHCANLLDVSNIQKIVSEIQATHLLHFAWCTEHKKYWTSLENYKWVAASASLATNFLDSGGKRIVMAGTCAEYDWSQGHCSERLTPLKPATLYGECKNALREKLEAISKIEGISSAWGRIFFLYGPGEHPDRLVSSVARSLLRGESIPCSDGHQKRDFLFVDDVAAAFVALLDSQAIGPVNIASGEVISVKKIIETIADKIGRNDLVRFGEIPSSSGDPDVLSADVSRIKNELHWDRRFSLSQGLDITINWWKNHLNTG